MDVTNNGFENKQQTKIHLMIHHLSIIIYPNATFVITRSAGLSALPPQAWPTFSKDA